MDQSNKPPEQEQRKPKTRHERGLPPFRLPELATVLPQTPAAPKPPEVVHPDLQENDIKAEIIVKLCTRNGTVFQQTESSNLPGLLDPANQGHMARVMETQFAAMRDLAIRGFNKLIDANKKPDVEAPKPNGTKQAEIMAMQKAMTRPPSPAPAEEGKPPYPSPPGSTFRPPLSDPPK